MSEAGKNPDFFISRAGADKAVAMLIAHIIREAGLVPFYQDGDFENADFMRMMEEGFEKAAKLIVLLSEKYQQSEWCRKEYNTFLAPDPGNLKKRVFVFRVTDCVPLGNLASLAYTDLVPVLSDQPAFRQAVREALGIDERKPGSFGDILARAGQQIRHPNIREVKGFTGRDEMLDALSKKLEAKSAVAIRNSSQATLAMRGMGGVGKTVLAQEYAWRTRERYCGIWWVRAEKPETLMDDLVELGARFIPGLGDLKPEDAALKTVDQLAQMRTEKPWLLVYDNAEGFALLRRFTPADNAHVLITTRRTDWFGEADEELAVDVFDRDTAIAYLLKQARNADATFSLAIENAAAAGCAEAETLMALFAFFAPDKIPLGLIPEDVLSEKQRDDALAALTSVSLAAHDSLPDGTPAVSVHRLVQEVMRGRLRKSGRFEDNAALAIRLINASYDTSESFESAPRNSAWLPHALAAIDHAPREGSIAHQTIWVCYYIGDFRVTRGELSLSAKAYELGSQVAAVLVNSDQSNVLWQYDLGIGNERIGNVQSAQGNLAKALKSYEARRDIISRLAKADPGNAQWQRDLSVSYEKVGDALVAQGNLPEALKAYRDDLAIAERLAKADPGNAGWQRDLSVAYIKVGNVLVDQGNLPEALNAHRDSLTIFERLAKADPGNAGWQRDLSVAYNKVGDVLKDQGNLPEALKAYRDSLEIRERLAKSDPGNAGWQVDLATSHGKLGQLYVRMGDKAGARRMFERGRAIVAPFAEQSGHQRWIGNLRSFDEDLAALEN